MLTYEAEEHLAQATDGAGRVVCGVCGLPGVGRGKDVDGDHGKHDEEGQGLADGEVGKIGDAKVVQNLVLHIGKCTFFRSKTMDRFVNLVIIMIKRKKRGNK